MNPMNNFLTLSQVYAAAMKWYGKMDIDSCCLAECRLMRGEKV